MIERLKLLVGAVLAVFGAAFALTLVSVPVNQLGAWFLALPPQTMAVVGSGAVVLIVPIITFFTTKSLEHGKSRENAVRQQKTAFYEKLIDELIAMLGIARAGTAADVDRVAKIFASVPAPLLTFGSGNVIRAWNRFMRMAREDSSNHKAVLVAFEGLIKAMRTDLGHKDFFYEKGELISAFLKDAETIFPKLNQSARPNRRARASEGT